MLEAGLAQGWTNERLARALDCGVSSLKRNFGPALRMRDALPDRLKLAIFAAAARRAIEKGDTGAIRQVRALIAEGEVAAAEARMKAVAEDDPTPIGKKEIDRRRAEEAAARLAGMH